MVHSLRKRVFDSSSKKWFKHKPSDPVITFIGKIKRKENKYSIHILPAKRLVHKPYGGIIHNSQKVETIQMSTDDRQINKMWHIHTREYYSDIKKNKYWRRYNRTTWIDLKNIMQSENNHKHYAKWKQVITNTIERVSQLTCTIFSQPTISSLDVSFPFQSSLL